MSSLKSLILVYLRIIRIWCYRIFNGTCNFYIGLIFSLPLDTFHHFASSLEARLYSFIMNDTKIGDFCNSVFNWLLSITQCFKPLFFCFAFLVENHPSPPRWKIQQYFFKPSLGSFWPFLNSFPASAAAILKKAIP